MVKEFKQFVKEEKKATDTSSFMSQFHQGFEVEMEHIDTAKGDLVTIARTVLDHLEEDMQYYSKMKKAGID